ncbi:MAG: exo-alpha-sialidase [Prosthecobacter sp.]
MKSLTRLVTLALCAFGSASAQDVLSELFNPLAPFPPVQHQVQEERSPEQRDPNGPWKNDVLIYRTKADGTAEQIGAFTRAGVPTLTRLQDGRLMAAFQSFPADDPRNFDRVAVSFSSDEGSTWTKAEPIAVEGLEEGLMRPFDPTLVTLPDGKVRLYFTSNRHHNFGVSTPQIYSAISQDGVHYTFEPGVRFGIEGRVVIDCAVVLHQGVFHLYSPDNGSTADFHRIQSRQQEPPTGSAYHATSTDGLTFTRVAEVRLDDLRWLGNAQSDGRAITFFGSGRGIATATSADGATWQQTRGFRLAGADPGAAAAKDGGWIIIATGPPAQNQWLAEWTAERQMFDSLFQARDARR